MSPSIASFNIITLIPAYNESLHIATVVNQTIKYLPALVIDDGSSDDTAEKAENAGAKVLRLTQNQGKGAALLNGFREALTFGVDAVIMLDADGQHDPSEIPNFLDAFISNTGDLIIGQRDFHQMPWLRRRTNILGTWLLSWAAGQKIPDNQSGYRLLSRRMIEATLSSKETSFEFEVEMIVLCITHDFRLDWIPIRTIYGDEKSHIRPFHHAFHFFRMVWQTRQAIKSGMNR